MDASSVAKADRLKRHFKRKARQPGGVSLDVLNRSQALADLSVGIHASSYNMGKRVMPSARLNRDMIKSRAKGIAERHMG